MDLQSRPGLQLWEYDCQQEKYYRRVCLAVHDPVEGENSLASDYFSCCIPWVPGSFFANCVTDWTYCEVFQNKIKWFWRPTTLTSKQSHQGKISSNHTGEIQFLLSYVWQLFVTHFWVWNPKHDRFFSVTSSFFNYWIPVNTYKKYGS